MKSSKQGIVLAAMLLLGQGCTPAMDKSTVGQQEKSVDKEAEAPASSQFFRGPAAPPNMKGPTEPPPAPAGKMPRGKTYLLETKGETPTPRQLASSVFHDNGVMYVFGGQDAAGYSNDLYQLKAADGVWSRVRTEGPKPSPRFASPLMLDSKNSQIYLFGGQSDESPFLDDFWRFDLASGRWLQIEYRQDQVAAPVEGKYPDGRYGHGGIFDEVAGGPVIFGGFIGAGRSNETWRYDLALKRWVNLSPDISTRPQARCLLAMVKAPGDKIFWMFGGQSTGIPGGKPFLGDLWNFDLIQNAWHRDTFVGDKIEPRKWPSISSDGSKVVIFGGESAKGYMNDIQVYELGGLGADVGLKSYPSSIPARSGHTAAGIPGGLVYIFGGVGRATGPGGTGASGEKLYNDVCVIDLKVVSSLE